MSDHEEILKCYLCLNRRWICPCDYSTMYRIPKCLEIGCGVSVRCPACVDYFEAEQDVKVFKPYLADSLNPVVLDRYAVIRAAILRKYPDWDEKDQQSRGLRDVIGKKILIFS